MLHFVPTPKREWFNNTRAMHKRTHTIKLRISTELLGEIDRHADNRSEFIRHACRVAIAAESVRRRRAELDQALADMQAGGKFWNE